VLRVSEHQDAEVETGIGVLRVKFHSGGISADCKVRMLSCFVLLCSRWRYPWANPHCCCGVAKELMGNTNV
jgi:hypothetical protein